MAFTPQSAPTRVSTLSDVIYFTTSKLRNKLYYIRDVLAVSNVSVACTLQNLLFGVNGIYWIHAHSD